LDPLPCYFKDLMPIMPILRFTTAPNLQMCLTWKAEELYDSLVDFIYFHMIIVFDADAETTYRRHNRKH